MGNAPKQLHDAGQSLWLDYITREIVENGTLERYIDELSLTGLTSNPTIFDKALSGGDSSNGTETSHSRSIPSAVVNRVWSPRMASRISRS